MKNMHTLTMENTIFPIIQSSLIDPRGIQLITRNDERRTIDTSRVIIDGECIDASPHLLRTIYKSLGTKPEVCHHFPWEAVFSRAIEQNNVRNLRLTVEATRGGRRLALAVIPDGAPFIEPSDIAEVFRRNNSVGLRYRHGLVEAFFDLDLKRHQALEVRGDRFTKGFMISHHLDGFGRSSGMATLWRRVCTNGVIADHSAFTEFIPLTKEVESPVSTLERYITAFSGADAFGAYQARLEAARSSPASVAEVEKLHGVLTGESPTSGAAPDPEDGPGISTLEITEGLAAAAGTIEELYGLGSYGDMPKKRRRMSPMRGTISDILNVATEIGSHRADTALARRIDEWVGDLLVEEFDLEGTLKSNEQPRDLFLHN